MQIIRVFPVVALVSVAACDDFTSRPDIDPPDSDSTLPTISSLDEVAKVEGPYYTEFELPTTESFADELPISAQRLLGGIGELNEGMFSRFFRTFRFLLSERPFSLAHRGLTLDRLKAPMML